MKPARLVPIVVLVLLATAPVWADAGDQKIRFGIQYMSATGDLEFTETDQFDITSPIPGTVLIDPLITSVEAKSATGVFFEWEFMTTDAIGIAVGLATAKHDVEIDFSGSAVFTPFDTGLEPEDGTVSGGQDGDLTVMPLTVALNFHFVQNPGVDVYAGPVVGYVFMDDLEIDPGLGVLTFPSFTETDSLDGETVRIDDTFAYGAFVGVDAALGGGGWFFHGSAGYMLFSAEIDEPGAPELDIDPFVLRTGVGVRF